MNEIDIKILNEFLIKAKKETYANSSAKKINPSRLGSKDYEYETMINGKSYKYHDTYFGGTKFIGEEVVYIDSSFPLWAMNYYGVTLDESLSEEFMDNALRPALMKVGIDEYVLPLRGPSKFENNGFIYTFKTEGTIENFEGLEEIYKDNKLIYKLYCHGGIIK